MAEQAAILYKEGIAPCVLPSGRCSVMLGKFAGVQAKADKYYEEYQTEWDFLKDVLVKNGVNENDILKEMLSMICFQRKTSMSITIFRYQITHFSTPP